MQDLVIDLQTKLQRINKAIDTLARNGQSKAKAEMEYRIALRQEILLEREKGTPVTIISDICRGHSKIASLKFARDTAEVVYEANLEAIMAWKMEAKMIENQLAREWGRND
jgi:predicted metal-dependent RNase